MSSTADAAWSVIESLTDADTLMLYDKRLIPGQDPRSLLPSAQQVADDVPNRCGWWSNIEDCALNAGTMLPWLIAEAERTGAAHWRDRAFRVADSLLHLTDVCPTRGFLARGVLLDGRTFYRNSSADQYTMAVWALHRLWHWPQAGEARRLRAQRFLVDAAEWLRRSGWNIPTADGRGAWVCETAALWPDRGTRLLEFVLAAWRVSGDVAHLQRYRELRDECGSRRARGIFSRPGYEMIPYTLLQTQVSLHLLAEVEPDEPFRLVWRMHMHDLAEHAIARLDRMDPERVRAQIRELDGIRNSANWSDLYDEQDLAERHDLSAVLRAAAGSGADRAGIVHRCWQANPALVSENAAARECLEYLLCWLLCGARDIVDCFGRRLSEVADRWHRLILRELNPGHLRLAHSATMLLAVELAMRANADDPPRQGERLST